LHLRLIRNATLQLEYAGLNLLVDPMLAEPHSYRSLTWGASAGRNPTVPLPCPVEDLLSPDVVLLTHTHFDHFDGVAGQRLDKRCPVWGQPSDQPQLQSQGFEAFQPIGDTPLEQQGIQVSPVDGQHGKGLLGRALGSVSGFVLKANGEPALYIVGDSIWYPAVQAAIQTYHPEIIVVNCGAAQFNIGAPIIMTGQDVVEVCKAAPWARVIAVHMEAVNHCRLTRQALAKQMAEAGVASQVVIPQDGDEVPS
jgi:L-ascorbate metabolism protein UlaG (beta-lactamase superfamily)